MSYTTSFTFPIGNGDLTGDELTLNEKSYAIKYKDGTYFNLGKLLKREKFYCPFHGSHSHYNNIFVFENNPDMKLVPDNVNVDIFHNNKLFYETPSLRLGGKKTNRKRKSRKVKKSRRKSTRRR